MPLRALHISTFDRAGGAARTTGNLCAGLQELGCDTHILVRDLILPSPDVVQAVSSDKHLVRRHHQASLIQRKLVNPARSPFTNTWFSLPEPGWDISGHPSVLSADVLHLHWVSGFLSPASIALLQKAGKPVLWTLHDQRPFSGGCHFSAGCRRFERDCDACPQLEGPLMFGLTQGALAEARRQIDPARLTIVSPSQWMANCARSSALFSNSRIEVIPNSVNSEDFKPAGPASRHQLGWPDDTIVLLAGAGEIGEIRKGFGLLLEALRICWNRPEFKREAQAGRIRLVLFGKAQTLEQMPLPVQFLGRVDSQKDLARIYTAADVALVPSIEDNLPNTMLEALCCGTPVIGFNIGGLPDGVTPGENGWLVGDVSPLALARELLAFCLEPRHRKFDRATVSKLAAERFSIRRQAEKCLALYNELISANRGQADAARQTPVAQARPSDEYEREFVELLRDARRAQWRNRWLGLRRALGISRRQHRATD